MPLPDNLSARAFAAVIGRNDDLAGDLAGANIELNEQITEILWKASDDIRSALNRHDEWCQREGLPTEKWSAVNGYDLDDLRDALQSLTPGVLPRDKAKARRWADGVMQGRV